MIKIILLTATVQVVTSLSVSSTSSSSSSATKFCTFDAHILKPIITLSGNNLIPSNPSAIQTFNISVGTEFTLSCNPGKFLNTTISVVTAKCIGDLNIEVNGKVDNYNDFECDFSENYEKQFATVVTCANNSKSIRVGFQRESYGKSAIIGELCYDEIAGLNFGHTKFREINSTEGAEQLAIAIENENYFDINSENEKKYSSDDKLQIDQQWTTFNTYINESSKIDDFFDFELESKSEPFDSYLGFYQNTKNQTTTVSDEYIWELLKFDKQNSAIVFLYYNGGASKMGTELCASKCGQITSKKNADTPNTNLQCCEYYEIMELIKILPAFEETVKLYEKL